ncbi:potassium channel family protein [Streptomyces sp. FXJ1.172]|uniref:potassium channel family protein n=1 Tax=Streptomyces sp. FXJ1.172 TaxID=710705 RepID=UPI0007CF7B85|nr:potassium channel family protein [Streptomyces sp. FXJ1.172]WEO98538.1 potassium channel family protein [Streptomyces sp. FXJ1.172]
MDDYSRKGRWEQRTDLLLACASLVFLCAYAVHVLATGLSDAVHLGLLSATYVCWALFVVDYAVRWRFSGQGLRFVRQHWLDTLVVLLPLLRPLRLVRTYELVEHRHGHARMPLHARVMTYASLSVTLLGFAGALSVYHVEHAAPGASIRTFGDSVWWTCATLTTVGYGDVVPVTTMGRIIAVGMMIVGLGLFGVVTGSFSSLLVQQFARGDDQGGEPAKREGPPGS